MCICFNECGQSPSGWNCGTTESLTAARMLRVLVSALGSIKSKPKACNQLQSLRSKISTFHSVIYSLDQNTEKKEVIIKMSKPVWSITSHYVWVTGNRLIMLMGFTFLTQERFNCNYWPFWHHAPWDDAQLLPPIYSLKKNGISHKYWSYSSAARQRQVQSSASQPTAHT